MLSPDDDTLPFYLQKPPPICSAKLAYALLRTDYEGR